MYLWGTTLIFSLSILLVGCDAKDRCLDQGGSYDEISQQCNK
ncbi:hypothetical protein [Otariodibacter oris]|uniref:Uncharacterized protein n=1 Tax=Otariodibacter oris TaxID=1032623 RepID=A0A420XFB1_9PAST|nr:hypothetical protein [Otariodibacter oris]RKR71147.1 hypothetical protein DES31_1728 [Otariodibacter oris]